MKIEDLQLVKRIFEAALMAAEKPLMRRELVALFDDLEKPDDEIIDQAVTELGDDCESRGYELKRVASGYRYQVRQDLSRWVSKLWHERSPRYSRALLETLALIAYRQPITRGEIEEIRGVAVSSNIIKTLLEREWIKAVGHRDVPGRPAIYATTKQLLDYFDLKSLDQLPPLAEVRDLSTIGKELNIDLPLGDIEPANDAAAGEEAGNEEPSAEVDEEPSAEVDEEPSAEGNEEPSAEGNEEPSAEGNEEPSAEGNEEPSVEGNEEPPAQPQANDEREDPIPGNAGAEIAAFESWVDDELDTENAQADDETDEQAGEYDAAVEEDTEIELQASAKDDNASGPINL